MTTTPHYPMILDWSDEDGAYVVTLPDLPGCRTHGATYEEAARKGQEAVDSWVEATLARGQALPAPAHRGLGERLEPLGRALADAAHTGYTTSVPD